MMENVQSILVPIDFSELSEAALQSAIHVARRYGSRITLVHVYHISVYSFPDGAYVTPANVAADISSAAQRGLDALVKQWSGHGIPIKGMLREGVSHEEIAAAAHEEKADLIILSTRGRKGLARAILGSVAELVIRSIDVPVLVVRPPHVHELSYR